ncbi:uncharacterized mitochondrial protein-like protein [Tanacetum coccineum]
MSTDKESSAAGTDNRPPMLVESDYDSWKIRIHRYIRGKPLGKLIWNSIQNGPSPHPMVTDAPTEGQTGVNMPRMKLDSEFTPEETNRENADTQAEIILSQGLPRHIFNILNQTNTAKEIWDNVEMLMQGSGRTLQQRKEDLFDEFERFRAIGNEPIHDYFVHFHKLVNDMKITQLEIPTHQLNTKFVNNLPSYWAYEPRSGGSGTKTLKKQEQSSSIIDPLAYMAQATPTTSLPPPSTSQPQPAVFSGHPPTRGHMLGQIITETVQRRAPGNVGNTGNQGTKNYRQMTDNVGKKVICYNCRGEGHVSRQCKEKKRVKDSQYFKDKMLLMEAKEKGTVLDAEAEAFLADVECTAPYDQPLAIATTNMFEVSHENAYDSDIDKGPHAAQLSWLTYHPQVEPMEEHLNFDVESNVDDNTIPYHQYQLDSKVQDVPTEVSSAPPGEISMITILDDLRTQLDGHLKVNQEQCLVNDSLRVELARCKQEMVSLERNKVKHDLDQTIVQRNKRNAKLEEENVLLKLKLSQNVESINSLKNESKMVISEKKVLEDMYLEEIVCLKSANKVATEILQRFQQPTQTIPMLTKRSNLATHDLHKTALGSSNPWNLKQAKLSQPTLYDGHALLNPTHTSVKVHDSEDSLVHAEVSRTKMSKRLGTIKPINYAELNALYSHFVPQKELSREQVYWLPAEELATQKSNPPKPVTPFVRTRPAKSQISTCLQGLNSLIPAFAHVIHQRTDPCRYPSGSGEFKPVKAMFTEQIIPFYENVKQLVQKLNANIVTEVTEYMRIFDELDTEYERCVLANKNLKIERKNLLIQNDCLIANSLEKDICTIVLASDIVVPSSSNCLCEELKSNCDREHSKVVELEAEILKKQQMLNESKKRCAFIKKNHVNLQVKFQKYKECLQNQRVCDNSNSTASNAIFEINKLKDQLQGKDDTIRNLQTQINIMRMLNVRSIIGSFDKQALETKLTQLKDALTLVRIQIDGYKAENINALTVENAKLKTKLSGKKSNGSTASEKPKVLASGMYTNSSKYVPPPKRANWVKPTPLPKKKQVIFQEPLRTSNRPTQKPLVQQNKKPNVTVNLSTRTKPATESRKPMPKSHTRNHHILPSKSVNARRAADHNRKLNVVDHTQFVIRSLKSVNTTTPQAKHSVNHTKKVWKATRNHNVNTTKTAWRPTGKVVGNVKSQWKPTGRHFALYDNCPLTRIMKPIVEPLELTPSVSYSSKVTMISRSFGCTVADYIAERLKRPTAYKFRQIAVSLLSRDLSLLSREQQAYGEIDFFGIGGTMALSWEKLVKKFFIELYLTQVQFSCQDHKVQRMANRENDPHVNSRKSWRSR